MSPLTEALLHGSVRRTVWLMLGAAIGLAAVLVAVGIAQLVASLWPSETALLVVASLLLIPLIGLIPGVRELEVTAGRSLLQPR
ncbi:MAG TPA: hypothetical protein VFU98_13865 [Microlunatus sp.]|nr:hypothetical protein [Microlunatus sp.]